MLDTYLPNTGIRWLHLSDFHTGSDNFSQSQLFEYILEEVEKRVKAEREPHIVFISGDIAHWGKETEYEKFSLEFLYELMERLQRETRSRIFLIPGNHDVDRKKAPLIQCHGVLERHPRVLYPTQEGLELREDLLKRFQAFADFDPVSKKVDGVHWLLSPQGFYTDIFEINRHSVGVLCLNTAWFCQDDGDRYQLSPGEAMLEEGLKRIKDCQTRIVLGHHPIDWFISDEYRQTRAILGKYHAIYLHGHLHETTFGQEIGAGLPFVSIQAGASFQARKDKHWVNSFLWCELNDEYIRVESRRWSRDNYAFSHGEPDFPEEYRAKERGQELAAYDLPLPRTSQHEPEPTKGFTWDPPPGWEHITPAFLESQKRPPEEKRERLLQFFDGRLPDWNDALLPDDVPQREIVHELEIMLTDARQRGTMQVTLLLGAAGEGKSTALRQVVRNLVLKDTGWQVWWRLETELDTSLPSIVLQHLPRSGDTLLIVSDDAGLIAKNIYEVIKNFKPETRRKVQFFLCCQELEWQLSNAHKLEWEKNVLVRCPLKSVSLNDATSVIKAWKEYGEEGLGTLKGLETETAAHVFLEKARSIEHFSNNKDGSFFGAMLAVRHGDDLKEHIRAILARFYRNERSHRKELLKVLVWIATVHCINAAKDSDYVKLSRYILAQLLGCKMTQVYERVIMPLGDEALGNETSGAVYARHQEIARVVVQLMPEFGFQFGDVCYEIIQVVLQAWDKKLIPGSDMTGWNRLPAWFYKEGVAWLYDREGNKNLGVLLAQAFIDGEPHNAVHRVQLAKLYRDDDRLDESVNYLRDSFEAVHADREYYYEWATSEGKEGYYDVGVWLSAVSVADAAHHRRVDNPRAMMSLAGLAIALVELYREYKDTQEYLASLFLEGCAGAIQLGFTLKLNNETRVSLQRSNAKYVNEKIGYMVPAIAFEKMQKSIIAAYNICKDELPSSVLKGDALTYNQLARILKL